MQLTKYILAGALGFSAAFAVQGELAPPVSGDKLNAAELKSMLTGLGYEIKTLNDEPGKEKYSIPGKTDNFNIPVGVEISPSGNYIWLTVNLGPDSDKKDHGALLKDNGSIQPSFFYVTSKDALMMAQAIDNRSTTSVVLKRCLDKIIADVDKTSKHWKD